jgi:hypothetical protein
MSATSLRRIGALALLTLASLLTLAAAARASSIQLDVPDGQPVQDAPTVLHLTGTIPFGAVAVAQAHMSPAREAASCRDMPGVFTRKISERIYGETFEMAPTVTFARPGRWLVCAWVWIVGLGGDDVGAVTSTIVDVRPPHMEVRLDAPRAWLPSRTVSISVHYSSEVSRQLFIAAVHGRCGHSWRAARQRSAALLLGGQPVVGNGDQRISARIAAAGRLRLCAYVERDAADGDAGAVSGLSVDVAGRRRPPEPPPRINRPWELG